MENLKKSIKLKKSLVLLILALAVYSCKKGNSPLPSAGKTSQVSFGVQAINSTAVLASTSGLAVNSVTPVIQFTSGVANISKFKLEAKTVNRSVEIETKNLMNVNLFAPTPALIGTTLDTGIYKEIEVSVVLLPSADTTARPLTLKGSFTASDGTIVPVEFDINESLTIKAEVKNVTLDNNTDLSTIVLLHLDKVVAGITAADLNAASKTAGKIIISSTSNVSLFNKIKFNVEGCGDTEIEHEGGEGHHGNGGGGDGSNHG